MKHADKPRDFIVHCCTPNGRATFAKDYYSSREIKGSFIHDNGSLEVYLKRGGSVVYNPNRWTKLELLAE